MSRRKQPAPEKTTLERAAVAVCRRVYGARCPCENAPSVCQSMRGAALAAAAAIEPEIAERLLREELGR